MSKAYNVLEIRFNTLEETVEAIAACGRFDLPTPTLIQTKQTYAIRFNVWTFDLKDEDCIYDIFGAGLAINIRD